MEVLFCKVILKVWTHTIQKFGVKLHFTVILNCNNISKKKIVSVFEA